MSLFYNGNNPLWFAHRGASTAAPENTISAYTEAIKRGVPALEIDVIRTLDGVVLCSHNFDLESKTDYDGYIDELPYARIKDANTALNWNSKRELLPKLEDVLKIIPKHVRLNIEIKFSSPFDFSTVSILRKELIKNKIRQPILISSFNPFIVFYARWFIPNIKTGYLVESMSMIKWMHLAHPDCLHPRADLLNEDLLENCKTKNISINTWTVNSIAGINYCKNIGVDGIITDRYNFEHP